MRGARRPLRMGHGGNPRSPLPLDPRPPALPGRKEPALTGFSPESSTLDWPLAPKESGMKDTSRNKRRPQTIRRGALGLGRRSEKAMADLRRRAMSDSISIDTSDIPEQEPADGTWVRGGHLVGGIRGAIIGEMQRQGLTRYQLWKKARVLCPKLPSSAVYEYLDGRRQAGGTYIEALLNALGLEVKPKATGLRVRPRAGNPRKPAKVGRASAVNTMSLP